MRIYTKEYYKLMMDLDIVEMYEPVIDQDEYTESDIEELYQKAADRYIMEEQLEYDEPPELDFDDIEEGDEEDFELMKEELAEYENRPPFDEEEAREEFEEMYRDNLEEPDEDLPDWVRETVDKRILAMEFLPEKIYRKLKEADEENQKKFDAMDEKADEAVEEMEEALPEDLLDVFEELRDAEDCYVTAAESKNGDFKLSIVGWDDEGDARDITFIFSGAEILEDEGIAVKAWKDEDGDPESDCEMLFCEMYAEGGMPEVHMLFDNNGLKYLTLRCSSVKAV